MPQKLPKFSGSATTLTFGDVAGYGHGGAANLGRQSKALVRGEGLRAQIDFGYQFN
jgi:hypothetical protein